MEALRFKEQLKAKYLKESCLFRMQATEVAMIQTKIKSQLDCERAQMTLSEMESKLLNMEKTDDEIENGLKKVTKAMSDGIDLKSEKGLNLALGFINTLQKSVISLMRH